MEQTSSARRAERSPLETSSLTATVSGFVVMRKSATYTRDSDNLQCQLEIFELPNDEAAMDSCRSCAARATTYALSGEADADGSDKPRLTQRGEHLVFRLPHGDDTYVCDFLASFTDEKRKAGYICTGMSGPASSTDPVLTTAVEAQHLASGIVCDEDDSHKNDIDMETIAKYFRLPISSAARRLRVGETWLKQKCRQHGINRWPYRKVRSIEKFIRKVESNLQEEEAGDATPSRISAFKHQIADLEQAKHDICLGQIPEVFEDEELDECDDGHDNSICGKRVIDAATVEPACSPKRAKLMSAPQSKPTVVPSGWDQFAHLNCPASPSRLFCTPRKSASPPKASTPHTGGSDYFPTPQPVTPPRAVATPADKPLHISDMLLTPPRGLITNTTSKHRVSFSPGMMLSPRVMFSPRMPIPSPTKFTFSPSPLPAKIRMSPVNAKFMLSPMMQKILLSPFSEKAGGICQSPRAPAWMTTPKRNGATCKLFGDEDMESYGFLFGDEQSLELSF